MKKVICIGSATRDIFVYLKETKIIDNRQDITAKRLMAFELGAKEYASGFYEEVGGSAVNVGAGLVKAEIKSFVFSRVSKGEDGLWITKKIGKFKIKKNYLQKTGGEKSETSVIIADEKNRNHVILRTGDSVDNFDLEKAIRRFREKVDWLFFASQKRSWQAKMKLAIEFAKNKKAKIAFNPSSYQIKNSPNELADLMPALEIIFVNRDEAIELIKNVKGKVEDDMKYLLKELKDLGVKIAVITDGEKGAYVTDGSEDLMLKAKLIGRNDTVGAGDAFSSGFLAGYIENEDISRSLAWGIANSAGVVSRPGATNGLLKKKELKKQEIELINQIKRI
jgi:sugar/nucleoside kinase (ribokinase family)